MKLALTKGMNKVEKFMLRTYRVNLIDIMEVHHIDRLMTQHDFPRHIELELDNPNDLASNPPAVDYRYNY
jgi:hypothetical protein